MCKNPLSYSSPHFYHIFVSLYLDHTFFCILFSNETFSSTNLLQILILQVLATDQDVGDQVEYSIIADSTNRSDYFFLHSKQGFLSLHRSIRNFAGEHISFFVRATDMANPPHQTETSITISVVSSSISLPRFSKNHFLFNVAENTIIGSIIGKLHWEYSSEISP